MQTIAIKQRDEKEQLTVFRMVAKTETLLPQTGHLMNIIRYYCFFNYFNTHTQHTYFKNYRCVKQEM